MKLRLILISDTHNMHELLTGKFELPKGNILIHAGDITMAGDLDPILNFNEWLGTLSYKHKIVIAGNHDKFLADHTDNGFNGKKILNNATYLDEETINIKGINIYGSPYTPSFSNMRKGLAFYKERGIELKSIWDEIPDNTDILITHGPPYGILDKAYDGSAGGFSVGDKPLLEKVLEVKPKYHVFGHIHEDGGKKLVNENTTFINASVINKEYELTNKPRVITYEV